MRNTMSRGKQQILFNNLPGRTIDFEGGVIARISHIHGVQVRDVNVEMLLARVQEQASAWPDQFRPGLRDEVLRDATRFVVLDPRSVEAEFFPKVVWCDNQTCGRVLELRARRGQQPRTCPTCQRGRLNQLRFVRVHRCGDLSALSPPQCRQCSSNEHMALDTRGSERISNFRWICRSCNTPQSFFPGPCRACDWPGASALNLKMSSIEVHRAGRTFCAHTATLLNVPTTQYANLFNSPEWKALVAAKFLQMPIVADRRLNELRPAVPSAGANVDGMSGDELNDLLKRQASGEISAEDVVRELGARNHQRAGAGAVGLGTISEDIVRFSGTSLSVWDDAGQELLESMLPSEIAHPRSLRADPPFDGATTLVDSIGIAEVDLLSDFPIVLATYGFSRIEAAPRRAGGNDILCRLNPFPQDREHGGRWPIYVDQTTADALLVRLSATSVVDWLRLNGSNVVLPAAADNEGAAKSYIVNLLTGVRLRETIPRTSREARMVFGLIHTFGHLLLKEASLLCGLDRTSLAEYLLPRSLTFIVYCNHKSGQGIGALTALFEQSLAEWLGSTRAHRRCVYDPVCRDDGCSCHACTHLSETSCRFFNMNLSRSFLFGGHDAELGDIPTGYLDVAR
jgi:hypothetical protein